MQFRTATPADAPFITNLVNRAYEVERALFGAGHDRTDVAEITANIETPGTCFILGANEGVSLSSVRVETQPDALFFSMLAVDPTRQGGGVGRAVVQEVERLAAARGLPFVRLNCIQQRDLPAYYGRLGYTATHDTPYTIADVEIVLVYMEKRVTA